RAFHLRRRLGEARQVAIGKDVAEQEIGLAGALPVELVMDAVVQIEPAVLQELMQAAEERRIVRDPDVLDDANRRDLVVAGLDRDVAPVAILHETAVGEALALDPLRRPLGLRAGEGDAVGAHAVVLGGPDCETSPTAADIEHALTRFEAELSADEIELVLLR